MESTSSSPWKTLARPEQLEPVDRDWNTWLILAGRGYGKTEPAQKPSGNGLRVIAFLA